MDLSGNTSLLDRALVAFFASRTSPPEAVALAEQWAHGIAQTDKVVISGFHSPIERAVLDILLSYNLQILYLIYIFEYHIYELQYQNMYFLLYYMQV